jgi:hypothetical protein
MPSPIRGRCAGAGGPIGWADRAGGIGVALVKNRMTMPARAAQHSRAGSTIRTEVSLRLIW